MGFLKPKAPTSSSLSENTNKDLITSSYSPTIGQGGNATNFLSSLLTGGGDTAAATGAFDNYKKLAGYAPALSAMQRGVTGGAAAKGLLNSGSTSKALVKYGSELDSGMFGNFLQQLAGLSGLGLQAGNLVANVGQKSTGTNTGGSPSTVGSIASTIGGIASIFSDRRLKRNITLLNVLPDGLGVYSFRMIDDPEIRIGVMADEVAELRPHALGPVVGGFQTVNYGAL